MRRSSPLFCTCLPNTKQIVVLPLAIYLFLFLFTTPSSLLPPYRRSNSPSPSNPFRNTSSTVNSTLNFLTLYTYTRPSLRSVFLVDELVSVLLITHLKLISYPKCLSFLLSMNFSNVRRKCLLKNCNGKLHL